MVPFITGTPFINERVVCFRLFVRSRELRARLPRSFSVKGPALY